jgi:hypothetical protein
MCGLNPNLMTQSGAPQSDRAQLRCMRSALRRHAKPVFHEWSLPRYRPHPAPPKSTGINRETTHHIPSERTSSQVLLVNFLCTEKSYISQETPEAPEPTSPNHVILVQHSHHRVILLAPPVPPDKLSTCTPRGFTPRSPHQTLRLRIRISGPSLRHPPRRST